MSTNDRNRDSKSEEGEFDTSNLMSWCRLCAKSDGSINIFTKNERLTASTTDVGGGTNDQTLCAAIERHFLVNISRKESLPKMVCSNCFYLVISVEQFSEKVRKVQQMFESFHSVPDEVEMSSALLKFGLLKEDQSIYLSRKLLPEIYYDTKAKSDAFQDHYFETEPERAIENTSYSVIDEDIKKEDILHEKKQAYLILDEEGNTDEKDPFDDEENLSENDMWKESNENQLKSTSSTDEEDQADTDAKKNADTSGTRKKQISESDLNELNSKDKCRFEIFTCPDCRREFKRIQHFRQHMERMHLKVVPKHELRCTDCNRSFNTKYQLEKHAKIHLPLLQKKVIPCPYCEKKFTTNTLVQTHIKYIHMNERPFICEECGIAVRTNAALKTHMLTHTDYAPFICEICKKGFKNQIRLKNHMETHDPNKHICAECGLQLNSRATLNRHLLVHSDEMQHKCDYCGRAFKRAKALKNHLILHTGLKPYSCDFCDRTFANGSNCRSHKKKAHPEELAALEAAGGGKNYTRNIPKLEALKAVTKATDNLTPVVSKQSGRFAFGKKPKVKSKTDPSIKKSSELNEIIVTGVDYAQLMNKSVDPKENVCDSVCNHVFKPATISVRSHDPANSSHVRNAACLSQNLHNSNSTGANFYVQHLQQIPQDSKVKSMQQHPEVKTTARESATPLSNHNLYAQILSEQNTTHGTQVKVLLESNAMEQHEIEVQSSSVDAAGSLSSTRVYNHIRPASYI